MKICVNKESKLSSKRDIPRHRIMVSTLRSFKKERNNIRYTKAFWSQICSYINVKNGKCPEICLEKYKSYE